MTKRQLDSKLCSLLVDGPISKGVGLNQYQTYKYRYQRLRKKNPNAVYTLERQFRNALEDARMLLDGL